MKATHTCHDCDGRATHEVLVQHKNAGEIAAELYCCKKHYRKFRADERRRGIPIPRVKRRKPKVNFSTSR